MARRTNMWLVYADETGQRHYQPWQDVAEVGNLIDLTATQLLNPIRSATFQNVTKLGEIIGGRPGCGARWQACVDNWRGDYLSLIRGRYPKTQTKQLRVGDD